jgi:hypothetical protein
VDGVQFVLAFRVGVRTSLVESLSVFVAHQDDGRDDHEHGDDRRKGGDESDATSVDVFFLMHFHHGSVGEDLAGLAGISWQTSALEIVFAIDAESVVHAGGRVALVDLDGAVFAGKSGLASADKIVDGIVARASVLARISAAIVDVLLAVGSDETGPAVALVVGDKVDASSPVLAGINFAIVDVVVAVFAAESDRTSALVIGSVFGQRTRRSICARRRSAGIDFNVTVDTLETLGAFANVSG